MKAFFLTIAAAMVFGGAAPAMADQARKPEAKTPSGWSYDIQDGKRVPKGKRQVNADGSWREEIRQGDCVTVKEKTSSGEYRETRHC
ncbi:hypothetical protein [Sphingosinicella humi]|uniref:Uncharacterized protein n=1 Tax=Allosphingosinicella humi TaxID=2068657 RepID=A0A2U2J1U3_9SPHN|nr:hypothetical protein [Sphingosinicella humi]PWG02282.1 hypothetical protein DF286_04950 [Sphingosinicella humi]